MTYYVHECIVRKQIYVCDRLCEFFFYNVLYIVRLNSENQIINQNVMHNLYTSRIVCKRVSKTFQCIWILCAIFDKYIENQKYACNIQIKYQ